MDWLTGQEAANLTLPCYSWALGPVTPAPALLPDGSVVLYQVTACGLQAMAFG
jgi:hypothetical protein